MIKGQKFGEREQPDKYTFIIGFNEFTAINNLGKDERSSMCVKVVSDFKGKRQLYFFEAKLGDALIEQARELGYYDPKEYMHYFKGKSVWIEGLLHRQAHWYGRMVA